MSSTIVCPTGTGAAKGVCRPEDLATWVAQQGTCKQAAETLLDRFVEVKPEGEDLQRKLSAEIHSLVRIGVTKADRVILLASDTDDGYACSLAVSRYLDRHFPGIVTEVERVKGLQVQDAELFRRKGVVEFVRLCLKAVHDFGAEQVILNSTAGFKVLVPYIVLIGMIKRVSCRYIFEHSSRLLTLPPLPVSFDRGPFERYRNLFNQIEKESSLPLSVWRKGVQHDDAYLLAPLIEEIGQEVTLSGVGLLLLDEFRTPTTLVPFLSRKAWTDCLDNLQNLKECDPFRFLRRVAMNSVAFKTSEHINAGNGLRWLKPGRTTDRYLVSVEDWRMLVWRAIREDEEGPDYPNRIRINPATDRPHFGPFTRMEFADDADG